MYNIKNVPMWLKIKEFTSGYDNTPSGVKAANKMFEQKITELTDIETSELKPPDTIENIFREFMNYKKKYNKVMPNTIRNYNVCFNSIFTEKDVEEAIKYKNRRTWILWTPQSIC